MERRFRRLASAPTPNGGPVERANLPAHATPAPLQKRHRVGVPAACELCRRRKSRCDGQRPACDRCRKEGVQCSYATAQGETHHTALKRKYTVAQEEIRQLRELFSLIHERPLVEASEIFKRVRASEDPLEVLSLVKQADLLLPFAHRAPAHPSSRHQLEEADQGDYFVQLPARPWSVAGTDRIVPEMMANLFLKRSILSRAMEEGSTQTDQMSDCMSID